MPEIDPTNATDAELIAAANNGDVAAFNALYFRYRDWVVRLARRTSGNDDDALDVLQETFKYVLSKFPRLTLTASMTTFLYPVVNNLSIAARRKRLRLASADGLDPAGPGDPLATADASRAELAAVMSSLPEAHRETLLLRFVDGLSLEEIAMAMAVPLGTVKSRLHHALASLRADPRTAEYFRGE